MSKYIVYQIPSYTKDEVSLINREGWSQAAKQCPKVNAFHAVTGLNVTFLPEYSEFYEVVAECEAKNLADVFNSGNLGSENYKSLVDRNRSVSVGDVVFDVANNRYYLCENFGWGDITESFAEVYA